MWVLNQDKSELVNPRYYSRDYSEGTYNIWCDGTLLGSYSSEAKARIVMSQIAILIESTQPNKVFIMPLDDKVEV